MMDKTGLGRAGELVMALYSMMASDIGVSGDAFN